MLNVFKLMAGVAFISTVRSTNNATQLRPVSSMSENQNQPLPYQTVLMKQETQLTSEQVIQNQDQLDHFGFKQQNQTVVLILN